MKRQTSQLDGLRRGAESPPPMEPPVDTRRAAEITGLSPRTLEKFRQQGGGPLYLKLNRKVLYLPEDLRRWLAARRRRSTSDPGEPATPAHHGEGEDVGSPRRGARK